MQTLVIGDSDEDSDWIKRVGNGVFQQEDLAASERALELHRARLGVTTKQAGLEVYTVKLGGLYVGRLEFGPLVSVDVRSTNTKLIEDMQQMITGPVYHHGHTVTVGMPEYPDAVLGKLAALGYTYEAG